MSDTERICLVLYPHLTREDFHRAAEALGFIHHQTEPGDESRVAYEEVWATADQSTAVNYLEDPLVGQKFIALRGFEVRSFVTGFAMRMELLDGADVLEQAHGAVHSATQIACLAQLAVTFPTFDPDAFLVFETFATHCPHAAVRAASVNAMGYRGWPEFLPLLEHVSAHDASETVRRRASEVAAAIRSTRR